MDTENDPKRPIFGNRFLTNEENVFQHNAWDNVEWTPEQEEQAKKVVESHAKVYISAEEQQELLCNASTYWNNFYDKHDNKFFKDRNWLFTEFPELLCGTSSCVSSAYVETKLNECCSKEDGASNASDVSLNISETLNCCSLCDYPGSSSKVKILEIGCGAGNTIFPVLQVNTSKGLFVYGCDYSASAVDIVKSHSDFNEDRCHVFVHDITSTDPYPMPEESLDIVVMIFVLSAVHFDKMQDAICQIAKLLKPGGLLLFRDYGRYDMAQLRFKSGRCLSENFYSRGDGTLVYFFTQEELRQLFTKAGLIEKQNLVDRRLQVNRAKKVKMYRVWIQAKYIKP